MTGYSVITNLLITHLQQRFGGCSSLLLLANLLAIHMRCEQLFYERRLVRWWFCWYLVAISSVFVWQQRPNIVAMELQEIARALCMRQVACAMRSKSSVARMLAPWWTFAAGIREGGVVQHPNKVGAQGCAGSPAGVVILIILIILITGKKKLWINTTCP